MGSDTITANGRFTILIYNMITYKHIHTGKIERWKEVLFKAMPKATRDNYIVYQEKDKEIDNKVDQMLSEQITNYEQKKTTRRTRSRK